MKRIILLILLQILPASIFAWEITPHENDGYYTSSYEEDMKYLQQYPEEDRQFVLDMVRKYWVPVMFISRLHKIESQYNQSAIRHERNGTVSIGYGQLNSVNQEWFADKFNGGNIVDFYDKNTNIRLSIIYYRYLFEAMDGDWMDATVAYNFGIGRLKRGDTIPDSTIEYMFLVLYGKAYIPCVQILHGAAEGIL